jgi:hypothetical protein
MDDKALDQMIATLTDEEGALAARLAKVRAARVTLESLRTEEPSEFEGTLSDAVRAVLKASTNSFSPTEIRDRLKDGGYDFSKHTNILASIHGVLKRIHESGDAETKEAKDGSGTRYRWKGPRELTRAATETARHSIPLNTILDQNALLSVLEGTEATRRLVEQLYGSKADMDRVLGGPGKLKEIADQISYGTQALENAGLIPKKK